MLKKLLAGLTLALILISPAAQANTPATDKGVLVVYLGSDDCRWCTWWESRLSGQELKFKATPEFKQLQYRSVKNTYLADPYEARDFPSDLKWVFDEMTPADRKPPRPTFLVYNDGKLVGKYVGAPGWEEKGFPAVRKLLAAKP
ncbi:hypothetical protein [Chitinimonas sp. BJYL2]|uniref:hypothetical protein n=1 Tax=Chitinimonas sp. BJYL2 TaxID=2976696 RepID=UPI0022B4987C|nr:hypothetical protein [Chitinimonas sp. BJYL2]